MATATQPQSSAPPAPVGASDAGSDGGLSSAQIPANAFEVPFRMFSASMTKRWNACWAERSYGGDDVTPDYLEYDWNLNDQEPEAGP